MCIEVHQELGRPKLLLKDRLPCGLLPELSQKARKVVEEGGFSLNSREVSW
jgi:hypothetical protein